MICHDSAIKQKEDMLMYPGVIQQTTLAGYAYPPGQFDLTFCSVLLSQINSVVQLPH